MKNYTYVYENSFSDDFSKLKNLMSDNDVSIAFSDALDYERKQGLIEFAETLENKKILLVQSSLGKGGVGQSIPISLISLATYSIFIIFSTTIITELTKDVYKKTLGKLFLPNKTNKYNIGNIVIEVSTDNLTLQYIFFDYFTADDSIEAFIKINEHINGLDKKIIDGGFARFIFDRKDAGWKLM